VFERAPGKSKKVRANNKVIFEQHQWTELVYEIAARSEVFDKAEIVAFDHLRRTMGPTEFSCQSQRVVSAAASPIDRNHQLGSGAGNTVVEGREQPDESSRTIEGVDNNRWFHADTPETI
jgi:hypothetical protein